MPFVILFPSLYHVIKQRYVMRMVGGGYAMFELKVLVSYFLIFPLTFRFLGTVGLPDFGHFRFDILYSVTFIEHDSSHTADNDYQYNISYKYSMLQ